MGDFSAAFYQVTSLLAMEDFSFLKHHRPFKLPGLMSVLVTEGESQSGLARNEQSLREQMWIDPLCFPVLSKNIALLSNILNAADLAGKPKTKREPEWPQPGQLPVRGPPAALTLGTRFFSPSKAITGSACGLLGPDLGSHMVSLCLPPALPVLTEPDLT